MTMVLYHSRGGTLQHNHPLDTPKWGERPIRYNLTMAIREIRLERIPSQDAVFTINKTGIYFSAEFIRKFGLQKMEGITFLKDDDDPYFLGFKFRDSLRYPNTLALQANGRDTVSGLMIKGSELISKSPVLQRIQKSLNKSDRTFELTYEKQGDYYFTFLRPIFELIVNWENRNTIPDDARGIYRYVDKNEQVLYIGKGVIKQRASSPERSDWGVHKIEYSILDDENKALEWESYYLDQFRSSNGLLPPFNRISGHAVKE